MGKIEIPRIASGPILRVNIEVDQSGNVAIQMGDPRSIPITGQLGNVNPVVVAGLLAKIAGQLIEQAQKGVQQGAAQEKPKIVT